MPAVIRISVAPILPAKEDYASLQEIERELTVAAFNMMRAVPNLRVTGVRREIIAHPPSCEGITTTICAQGTPASEDAAVLVATQLRLSNPTGVKIASSRITARIVESDSIATEFRP